MTHLAAFLLGAIAYHLYCTRGGLSRPGVPR